MEEFVIELNGGVARLERLSARERVAAYVELTKPRITFLIVLTAAAGFALASTGRIDYRAMLTAMVGIALLSSGIATLNQYMEKDLDALMAAINGCWPNTGGLRPRSAPSSATAGCWIAQTFRIRAFWQREYINRIR